MPMHAFVVFMYKVFLNFKNNIIEREKILVLMYQN